MKNNRLILSCVCFIFSYSIIAQTTKSVLFIGNSYTYSHNVPNTIKLIAKSNGDDLIYDQNTPGGYSLDRHKKNTTSLRKIKSKNWDHIILQDQSQTPAYWFDAFFNGSKSLINIINEAHPCVNTTIFFMTWGREHDYEPMQKLTTNNYNKVAKIFGTEVAPVGVAWKKVREEKDPVKLYSGDGSHQSFAGTYLAACVFYATIFDKSPIGISYKGSLSDADAKYLQEKAFEAYNEYVNLGHIRKGNTEDTIKSSFQAKFNEANKDKLSKITENCCIKTSVDLTFKGKDNITKANTEIKYIIYEDQGSGIGAIKNEKIPISFNVTPNTCTNETKTFPLALDISGIKPGDKFYVEISYNGRELLWAELTKPATLSTTDVELEKSITIFPIPVKDEFQINLSKPYEKASVTIYNSNGRLQNQNKFSKNESITIHVDKLSSGIYFAKIIIDGKTVFKKIVVK